MKILLQGCLLLIGCGVLEAKPLKVFILAGQSNMEGHAKVKTFPAMTKDPATLGLYQEMVDAEGEPIVCEDVWIAYSYGDFGGNPWGTKVGQLSAGWGSQHHVGKGGNRKIGPEFSFGITMNKLLGEPILLIKTAWGGRSLYHDFRPPSAGEDIVTPKDQLTQEKKKGTGKFYRLMIEYVQQILEAPEKVCPEYDPKEGHELAGFVWFQGFNDLVGPYPQKGTSRGNKDYSEYSRTLACLIRDVRADLSSPDLPFVVGVLGVGGKTEKEGTIAFRSAMAKAAQREEFRDNVINVFTEKYWPSEIDVIDAIVRPLKVEEKRKNHEMHQKNLSKEELAKAGAALRKERDRKTEEALSEEQMFLYRYGASNGNYHYKGSAKCFAQMGQAFAEALVNINDHLQPIYKDDR